MQERQGSSWESTPYHREVSCTYLTGDVTPPLPLPRGVLGQGSLPFGVPETPSNSTHSSCSSVQSTNPANGLEVQRVRQASPHPPAILSAHPHGTPMGNHTRAVRLLYDPVGQSLKIFCKRNRITKSAVNIVKLIAYSKRAVFYL